MMENLIKCYCGHTTTCDCGPEDSKQKIEKIMKQTAVEWLVNVVQSCIAPNYIPKEIVEQAKEIENKQQGYSKEDMIQFAKFMLFGNHEYKSYEEIFNEWFEQFKKK